MSNHTFVYNLFNEENREDYDFRSPHPLTPAKKKVTVTDTLREIAKTNKTATITVVPVVTATNELCDDVDVFRFEKMRSSRTTPDHWREPQSPLANGPGRPGL
jgi:hypothetical protein